MEIKQKDVLHLYLGSKILLAEYRFSDPVKDRSFTLDSVNLDSQSFRLK